MRSIIFLFVSVLLFISCGQDAPERYYNPEMIPYIDDISYRLNACGVDGSLVYNVTIYDVRPLGEDAGVCEKLEGYESVYMDGDYWFLTKNANIYYRLEILLHEIGHCVYNLDHTKNKNEIMSSPQFISTSLELFTRKFNNFCSEIISQIGVKM